MSYPIFVDMQGFVINHNDFIVKEVAFLKKEILTHYLFKSPVNWNSLSNTEKSCARWLMNNHHCLKWNTGDIDYKYVKYIFRRNIYSLLSNDYEEEDLSMKQTIYVKGYQKKIWLESILGTDDIIEVKDINQECDNISLLNTLKPTVNVRCEQHSNNRQYCAMNIVCRLNDYWNNK